MLYALLRWHAMSEPRVSFETLREHYGIWRWRIERDSSNRLVKLWVKIGASSLDDDTKVGLANVAWAVASFERAYDVLVADIGRAERAHNIGVPPVMKFLTGPYEGSLDYLLGMSLWMDLGDVLISYRTIVERFGHLRRPARRQRLPMAVTEVDRQIGILEERELPELSGEPITKLADRILHETWHPNASRALGFQLYWKDADPKSLDFAEGNFRDSLKALVEATLEQVCEFILAALQPAATT
jgi:hypothetical protein